MKKIGLRPEVGVSQLTLVRLQVWEMDETSCGPGCWEYSRESGELGAGPMGWPIEMMKDFVEIWTDNKVLHIIYIYIICILYIYYIIILYYIILYYIILYYIILYCIILYYIILYYIILYCIILYYIVLYCIILYCIILYYIIYIDIIYWYSKKCAWKWCDWTKTDKTMVMFRRKLSQGGIKFWSILPTLDKKCWYKFGCFPTGMAILILARFYLQ
jgi:hypothetical protein